MTPKVAPVPYTKASEKKKKNDKLSQRRASFESSDDEDMDAKVAKQKAYESKDREDREAREDAQRKKDEAEQAAKVAAAEAKRLAEKKARDEEADRAKEADTPDFARVALKKVCPRALTIDLIFSISSSSCQLLDEEGGPERGQAQDEHG